MNYIALIITALLKVAEVKISSLGVRKPSLKDPSLLIGRQPRGKNFREPISLFSSINHMR